MREPEALKPNPSIEWYGQELAPLAAPDFRVRFYQVQMNHFAY
jgi:hypothetical protein